MKRQPVTAAQHVFDGRALGHRGHDQSVGGSTGRSLKLCTATSTSPAINARSMLLVKKPVPSIIDSGTSVI